MPTDKKRGLTATSSEAYREMGMKNVEKDREITWEEASNTQRILNGNCSMWIKMAGLGKHWNQVDMMKETMNNNSALIPPMYLLCKDHKEVKQGDLPRTRPVVSGCKGINLNLNDIISDILEPLTRAMDSNEIISTENALHLADALNKEFETEAVLTTTDAAALYPSLGYQQTARRWGVAQLIPVRRFSRGKRP